MSYTIQQYHGSYNKTKRTVQPSWIVVHYTGSGTSKQGSARANCIYFSGGNRNASADYFIDDVDIYEYNDPSTYYTWHCGTTGTYYSACRNATSIGIEVCQNGNVPYTSAEIERLTWLVGYLMNKYGIAADHVIRHYDVTHKTCPYYYTPAGAGGNAAWEKLHAQITNGEEDMTDQEMQNAIWNYGLGSDGKADYNNVPAWQHLSFAHMDTANIWAMLNDTTDPTGRDMNLNFKDHIKWIAAKQAEQGETLAALQSDIDALGEKVDKLVSALSQ